MEVIVVGAIIMFILIYNNTIDKEKFYADNEKYLEIVREEDYTFLCYAKYGEDVDSDQLYMKRVTYAVIAFFIVLAFTISSSTYTGNYRFKGYQDTFTGTLDGQNHYIYKKWILERYPQAAEFEWEKTGRKINTPVLRLGNHEIPWTNIPHRVGRYVRKVLKIENEHNRLKGMNPVAYYLSHNTELQEFLDDYFQYMESIETIELRSFLKEIQKTGTATEKIQAVSLLSAIKLFYN